MGLTQTLDQGTLPPNLGLTQTLGEGAEELGLTQTLGIGTPGLDLSKTLGAQHDMRRTTHSIYLE